MTVSAASTLRVLSALVFSFVLLWVLGGASCAFCSGSCGDDDDDDDNSDSQSASTFSPPDDEVARQLDDQVPGHAPFLLVDGPIPEIDPDHYRLTRYTVERSDEPGRHPVARVHDIGGVSVFEAWGLGFYDARQMAVFAERVLDGNPDLLGLPSEAGTLRVEGTHFLDTIVVVDFEQRLPWLADADPGRSGAVRVVFDQGGRLLQVENDTELPPGVVFDLSVPLAASEADEAR